MSIENVVETVRQHFNYKLVYDGDNFYVPDENGEFFDLYSNEKGLRDQWCKYRIIDRSDMSKHIWAAAYPFNLEPAEEGAVIKLLQNDCKRLDILIHHAYVLKKCGCNNLRDYLVAIGAILNQKKIRVFM